MLTTKRKIRILNFDIENRPLSYWVPEMPTSEITAIASCWTDDLTSMEVLLLGELTSQEILERFLRRYDEADMVVGHYIRRHDLPTINGALLERGMRPLAPKLTSDTRLDMYSKLGVPATQEYLAELFALPIEKFHMSQNHWREANRLTTDGLRLTYRRVANDVWQNIMLREVMLHLGLLKPPRIWKP